MMKRMIFLLLALPVWLVAARAEDPAELLSLREKAQFAYMKIIEDARGEQKKVHDQYLGMLKDLAQKAQGKGDLNAVLALNKAIEGVEHSETLSDLEPVIPPSQAYIAHSRRVETDSLQKQAQLFALYQQKLDLQVKRCTREGQLEDAVAFQRELESCDKRLAALRKKLPEPAPAAALTPPLPMPGAARRATMYITCDNSFVAWLNGKQVAASDDWRQLQEVDLEIREGDILAIEATDQGPGNRTAGLFCCLVMTNAGGKKKVTWGTDETWRCSTKTPKRGWQKSPGALEGAERMDKGNIAPDHANRASEYRSARDKSISGAFVWSSDPAPKIYVKETLSLRKFN